MTTIGDLSLNDIEHTQIRVTSNDGITVTGMITDLRVDRDYTRAPGSSRRGPLFAVTTTQITVHGLEADHPCEVIA